MSKNLSPSAIANQREAQNRWHRENLDRITVNVPKGTKEIYKAKARERGISLNRLIVDYLNSL